MAPVTKRPIRLFEIDDQPWFPPFLRSLVQRHLAASWANPVPLLAPAAPASLATAHVIAPLLAGFPRASAVRIVEFAAGAGGPTPYIEASVNAARAAEGLEPVKFVLTDIAPNVPALREIAARSRNISFVGESVDAGRPPKELTTRATSSGEEGKEKEKLVRTYCLSFHHFPDPAARAILASTLAASDGFAIIELVSRHWSALLLMLIYTLTLPIVTVLWFPLDVSMLLFSYVVPVVPVVIAWDGFVSALRIRTFAEVMALIAEVRGKGSVGSIREVSNWEGGEVCSGEGSNAGWVFRGGHTLHTWPCGYLNWVVGMKNPVGGAGEMGERGKAD